MQFLDAAVVGGGAIGLLSALRLRQAGLSVALVERGEPGAEASWAAAGILGAQVEAHAPGPLLDLCLASRALYPSLAEELLAFTGIDIAHAVCGALKLAFTEAEEAALVERARWQGALGLRCALVGDLLEHPGARLGLWLPDDGQVDNRQLVRALREAIVRAGVELVRGEVKAVLDGELHLGDRVIRASNVVIAAGSWSGPLAGLPEGAVFPVRGQMISFRDVPVHWTSVVFGGGGYAVPRRDGRMLVGATVEQVGFDRSVTLEGVRSLRGVAATLFGDGDGGVGGGVGGGGGGVGGGGVGAREPDDSWAGLRPGTKDGLPIIGPLGKRTLVATGHYRNGILLAPRTAELVRALITGARDDGYRPFAPGRLAPRLDHPAFP